MHGPAFAWPQSRTWRTDTRSLWPWTLKNWLAWNRTSGHWARKACCRDCRLRCRRRWSRRGSFVHRTGSRLRHNHTWCRSLRCRRNWRRCRARRQRRSLWRRRCGCHWRYNRRRVCDDGRWSRYRTRRCGNRWRAGNRNGRPFCNRRRYNHRPGSNRSSRRGGNWRRSGGPSRRRSHNRFRGDDGGRGGTHRRRYYRLFTLRDGLEHISRTGNVRQIDLGPYFFFATRNTRAFCWRGVCFGSAAEVYADLLCFVLFERTGMRFLLGHSNERQHVENGLALNFQFSGEIVDSNLTHPAFLVPRVMPKSSSQPHGVQIMHSHVIQKM
jgi:hypothetical protein